MKKIILFCAIGAVLLGVGIVAAALSGAGQSAAPSEASKESTVPANEAAADQQKSPKEETSAESNSDSSSNPAIRQTAGYQKFTAAEFQKAADTTRVIFFYDPDQQASNDLNAVIRDNFSKLPSDVTIFSAHIKAEYELAKQLGVASPGVIVKYDSGNQPIAMYQASGQKPTIEALRTALDIQTGVRE